MVGGQGREVGSVWEMEATLRWDGDQDEGDAEASLGHNGSEGPGVPLRGEHPGGHENPGSGAREVASSVTGPRPLAWMRRLAQGRLGGKAGRALDRVPRPALWEPGQWEELRLEGNIWGFQLPGEDLGVFTGVVSSLRSDW